MVSGLEVQIYKVSLVVSEMDDTLPLLSNGVDGVGIYCNLGEELMKKT